MSRSACLPATIWGESTAQHACFRVQGSGCRVQGSGFRVQGSSHVCNGAVDVLAGYDLGGLHRTTRLVQISRFGVEGLQGYLAHEKTFLPPRTPLGPQA